MPRLTAVRKQALDEIVKQSLFEATVAVLREHGVDGLTMDRVAAAAGVAKGSLYHYFRGKRELLEFVHAKTIDPIFRDLEAIIATDIRAIEKLERHLRSLLEHIARQAQVIKLLFHDDTAHGLIQSSDRCSREAACKLLAEIFRQGIAEGVFRSGDPLMHANIFLGIGRSVLETQPGLQSPEQREQVYRLILDACFGGLATQKTRVD